MMYQSVRSYLEAALRSFTIDPSDSDYERGYEAAIREVLKYVEDQINES